MLDGILLGQDTYLGAEGAEWLLDKPGEVGTTFVLVLLFGALLEGPALVELEGTGTLGVPLGVPTLEVP